MQARSASEESARTCPILSVSKRNALSFLEDPPLSDEQAFLNRILSDLKDDAVRLVFADWLEECGDDESIAKAEFLRIQHEWTKLDVKVQPLDPLTYRLKELAVILEENWLAIVSKIAIENCERAFRFQCPRQWDKLKTTEDPQIRFCEGCVNNVYYCKDIEEVRDHAEVGHCVAIDLGVLRKRHDLEIRREPRLLMGVIDDDSFRQRVEKGRADAEREYGRPSGTRRRS